MQYAVAFGVLVLLVLDIRKGTLFSSRSPARWWRNLGFAAAALSVAGLLRGLSHAVQGWGLALVKWPNLASEAVACVLVAELFGWTVHYVKHTNGFLWKFHFQHHREEEYNLWMTAHTHALEVLASGTAMACLLTVLGFRPAVVEVYLLFYSLAKFFQHSSLDLSLGWLDRVVVTPAYHRWHHEIASRCNYAVCFTFFDVLFGTVRWPDANRPTRFGVHNAALPYGFWAEHLWFLRKRIRSAD